MVDSKLWSARYPVHTSGGTLWHGPAGRRQADRSQSVRSVLYETGLISRALGVPVQPLIAVHNAPVAGDGFLVGGVPVVPAVRLVELLRGNDGPPDRKAAGVLARRAVEVLPPYVGGA
jgi:hypothetical protein